MIKIFILVIVSSFILSQEKKLILEQANKGFYDKKNDINRLSGNVKFRYDSLRLEADRVHHYKRKQYAKLFGNITIHNGKYQTITSKNADYFLDRELAKLYQNVTIVDKTTQTTGDTVFYYKKTQITEIFGNGKIHDRENNIDIEGHYIKSDKREIIYVYGDAELNQITDSLQIFSDTLIIDKISEKSYAKSSVKLYQNDVYGEGAFAQFNHADSTMILMDNAHLEFDGNDVYGDSVYIVFKNKSIHSIDVIGTGKAFNVSGTNAKKNRFQGKSLYITFKNKKLNKMRAVDNAISVFYAENNTGINSISADSIHIYFKDGKVDYTDEFGGVQGTFYPAGYSGKVKNDK